MNITTNDIKKLYYDSNTNGIRELRDIIPVAPLVDRYIFSSSTTYLSDARTVNISQLLTKTIIVESNLIELDLNKLEQYSFLEQVNIDQRKYYSWKVKEYLQDLRITKGIARYTENFILQSNNDKGTPRYNLNDIVYRPMKKIYYPNTYSIFNVI